MRRDPDWKRIARERLDKIRAHERRWDRLGAETREIVVRELTLALHAQCVSVSDPKMQSAMREIARMVQAVAVRMTERIA